MQSFSEFNLVFFKRLECFHFQNALWRRKFPVRSFFSSSFFLDPLPVNETWSLVQWVLKPDSLSCSISPNNSSRVVFPSSAGPRTFSVRLQSCKCSRNWHVIYDFILLLKFDSKCAVHLVPGIYECRMNVPSVAHRISPRIRSLRTTSNVAALLSWRTLGIAKVVSVMSFLIRYFWVISSLFSIQRSAFSNIWTG